MKNLKRILALVLCLAMVMGLAVSAGATSFSDDESISEDNATAVEVLSALGIINGYPDGTYRPEDTITRAEVCKMIAVAFNGGDESINDLYADVVCGLTDIGGTWAEGYIKYCYATGIVDGYPDGTLLPDGEITGNELCQIMLNILGYQLDTSTQSWATAVMAKSSTVGLLTNVSTSVGSAITRQEAAQVIYNSLTLPIQKANALGVLFDSDETILSTYLGGTSETVVITANEYASLTDDEPTDAGVTETEDGDSLDWSTTIDMIGSAYDVWVVDDVVVYYEESADNTVEETSEAFKKLSKAIDMSIDDDDTLYFINFDDEAAVSYEADVRIEYSITIDADTDEDLYEDLEDLLEGYDDGDDILEELEDEGTYSNVIKAGSDLDDVDVALIKFIFTNSDDSGEEYIGEVYVGTQSDDDVSDYISYKSFVSKYLTVTEGDAEISENENGNYVRVIDNDGDGYAEYVLKTEYTMAVIVDISSSGIYTVSTMDPDDSDALLEIDTDDNPIVTEDDLDEDDVIVYALIDGVYYTNLAEVVTVGIDDIDYSDEELTADDDDATVYAQSGIEPASTADQESFDDAILNSTILFEITDAAEGYDYDLYLDNYGYVRALTLSDSTNGFGLLTDAYYYTTGRSSGQEILVDMVTSSVEESEYSISWSTGDWADYVTMTDYDDNGTWNRLVSFQSAEWLDANGYIDEDDYDDENDFEDAAEEYLADRDSVRTAGLTEFSTNVVLYAGDTDSAIIENPTLSKYVQYQVSSISSLSQKKYTLLDYEDDDGSLLTDDDGNTVVVYATTDTVYFYVDKDGTVYTWTGYSSYDSDVDFEYTESAYVIAHYVNSSDSYMTADVIVIEDTSPDYSAQFIYKIQSTSSSKYYITGLGIDDGEVDSAISTTGLYDVDDEEELKFYYTTKINKKSVAVMLPTSDYVYDDFGIFAAISATSASVNTRNYVYLTKTTSDASLFYGSSTDVYYVTYNAKTGYYGLATTSKVYAGDLLIVVVDTSDTDDVLYVIDVTQSDDAIDDMEDLWAEILVNNYEADGTTVTEDNYKTKFSGYTKALSALADYFDAVRTATYEDEVATAEEVIADESLVSVDDTTGVLSSLDESVVTIEASYVDEDGNELDEDKDLVNDYTVTYVIADCVATEIESDDEDEETTYSYSITVVYTVYFEDPSLDDYDVGDTSVTIDNAYGYLIKVVVDNETVVTTTSGDDAEYEYTLDDETSAIWSADVDTDGDTITLTIKTYTSSTTSGDDDE